MQCAVRVGGGHADSTSGSRRPFSCCSAPVIGVGCQAGDSRASMRDAMRVWVLSVLALGCVCAPALPLAAPAKAGVVLLAPVAAYGGASAFDAWTRLPTDDLVIEVADDTDDAVSLRAASARCRARGADVVMGVTLFPEGASASLEAARAVFGAQLRRDLDVGPALTDVIEHRARAAIDTGRAPRAVVVLVGLGRSVDAQNEQRRREVARQVDLLRQRGRFLDVESHLFRADGSPSLLLQSVRSIELAVSVLSQDQTPVVLVPLLPARSSEALQRLLAPSTARVAVPVFALDQVLLDAIRLVATSRQPHR